MRKLVVAKLSECQGHVWLSGASMGCHFSMRALFYNALMGNVKTLSSVFTICEYGTMVHWIVFCRMLFIFSSLDVGNINEMFAIKFEGF